MINNAFSLGLPSVRQAPIEKSQKRIFLDYRELPGKHQRPLLRKSKETNFQILC